MFAICRLMSATRSRDDAQNVRRYEGRIALMFEGYDAGPRPLVETPDCVRFFRAVDQLWGYWLYFLMPQPDVLNLAVLLLADLRHLPLGNDHCKFAINDVEQLRDLLTRLFASMNTLHANYGISEPASLRRTDRLGVAGQCSGIATGGRDHLQ